MHTLAYMHGSLPPMQETQKEFWAPGFSLGQPFQLKTHKIKESRREEGRREEKAPLAMGGHSKKVPFCEPSWWPSLAWYLDLGLHGLQKCEEWSSVVFSLLLFGFVAYTDFNSLEKVNGFQLWYILHLLNLILSRTSIFCCCSLVAAHLKTIAE